MGAGTSYSLVQLPCHVLSGISRMMKKGQRVKLSGWSNGQTSGYGLSVNRECRERVFKPLKGKLHQVQVVLPGHDVQPCCRISETFWTTCPEVRSVQIGQWMKNRGDTPWPPRNPPRYIGELVVGSGGTAELRIL